MAHPPEITARNAPMLSPLDWLLILAYLAFSLAAGAWVSRSASASLVSYFVADRSLPWWWIGTSIVATTFASDTPLVIAGVVATKGISGNWFWWSWIIGHVGVAVFFSPLWRRIGVVTDAELLERRYGPGPGTALRAFKAVYSSLVVNLIVLGWVFRAMGKIADPFLRWAEVLPAPVWAAVQAHWPGWLLIGSLNETLTIVALVALVGAYSSAGGLRGVILTDLFQFAVAMGGSVLFAWLAVARVGGLSALTGKLREVYGAGEAASILSVFPPSGAGWAGAQMMLIYLFVVWWAQHHADGGGYIAQRLCAAASPRDARRGMLWFTVANYVFRPWPWILIGLVSLALFPRGMEAPAGSLAARIVTDREAAYPLLMREFLPAGLLGLALAGMISAFMSTVDTHLNWGTSYLVNDLYARFLRPRAGRAEVIFVSRAAVLLMTLGSLAVAAQIGSIEWAWKFNVSLGAGLGLPVLLRWLWWRANAWTEVSGMVAAGLTTAALHWAGASPSFPVLLTAQVSVGGAAMLAATFLTQPVDRGVLRRFYRDALPPGAWGPVRERGEAGTPALPLAAEWALLSAAVFAGMFLAGALLVGTPGEAAGWAALLAASWGGAVLLRRWTGPSAAPA